MGNMREISLDECRRVSGGGDIVVTGRKTVPKHENNAVDDLVRIRDSGWGDDYDRFDDDSGGRGGGGGDAAEEPELVDTDGDGVPDSPEIVVTATVTHDQIHTINELAGWYQWGQNLALGLVAGERLMVSSLTAVQQLAAGTAISGTTSLPSIDESHYQANWNYLYWAQVGANKGYTPEGGMIYLP